MSREIWTTYSVKDHLEPRSLAIDLMLFDRLVFPVPEDAHIPPGTNPLAPNGEVRWVPDPLELARWKAKKWNPEAQAELLELLKPVVRKVSWKSTGETETQYRAEATRLAAQGLPDYAFQATRTVLTQDLPSYVDGVTAFGQTYRTFDEFALETPFLERNNNSALPAGALFNVLASEFFVPDVHHDDNKQLSDRELLRTTLDFVIGDSGFRTRRKAFMTWQQDFIRNGATDTESIRRAAQEMRDLLEDANRTAQKLTIRKMARYLFRIAPSALGVAGALAGGGPAFAVGGVFISLGAIAIDERFFKSSENAQFPQTAFIHDARKHFGWKPRSD